MHNFIKHCSYFIF